VQAPPRNTPGGQAIDSAIEMVLMLRTVFHLALRQPEAFASSVLRLLDLNLRIPDHTTLSRRSREFATAAECEPAGAADRAALRDMNQKTTGKGTVLSKAEAGYREPDHRYPCVMCRRLQRRALFLRHASDMRQHASAQARSAAARNSATNAGSTRSVMVCFGAPRGMAAG
jgi:hypothetical protein